MDPDSKVHGANMGPIWGRQDPGWPQVGPMNFAIWGIHSYVMSCNLVNIGSVNGLLPEGNKPLPDLCWIIINEVLWHSPDSNFIDKSGLNAKIPSAA